MSVQLNFKSIADKPQEYSIKRMINANGITEYFFNGQPQIAEEYLVKINEMHLNINNFCAYQGKLEELCFSGDSSHLL